MTRGIISFVFDDGYTEIMSEVLPVLEKYGIKATIAVPVETENITRSENATVAPLPMWKEYCEQKGHELAAHGTNHLPLPTLSEEQMRQELAESKEKTGANILIYPGGAFNNSVKKVAAEYFSAARTTKRGFETIPPKDKFELFTFNASQKNFSVWKWNIWALWAVLTNRWLIETYHHVNRSDKMHSVALADFEAHVKFISRLPVRVATLGNIISENFHNQ